MNLIIIAIILGVVEGLTEFLPVSSTGHMIIVANFIDFTGNKAALFEVLIQLGSILAVVFIYFKRFIQLIPLNISQKKQQGKNFNLLHIILAMLPAVCIGLLLHSQIKQLFNPINVAYALLAGAVLLYVAQKFNTKLQNTDKLTTSLDQLSYLQAFGIGCFQILALYPGFSRSGATISGGMLLKVSKNISAQFSFILAVPMMFGASSLDLYKSYHFLSMQDFPMFMTGLLVAFLVALIAIKFFMAIIEKISFTYFAIYRVILAIIVLYIFA